MGSEVFTLAVSLDYFCSSRISSIDGVVALGVLPLLHYFRNCEIKNTGLIQCFWSLRVILTKLLLVCSHTHIMTYFGLTVSKNNVFGSINNL